MSITDVEEATAEHLDRAEPVARTATAAKIFRYSEFVDIGEGAVECEHSRDGQCADPDHFHAWCRLPNPYQERDIREKAHAAKARRVRLLKDGQSDAALLLETELEKVQDPAYADTIIDELINEFWAEDYMAAQREVVEREEFEHIDQDREEYNRLHEIEADKPEAEQSDEFKALAAHLRTYLDALNEKVTELQTPRRDDFKSRPFEQLFDLLRKRRIDVSADGTFGDTWSAWTWFVGTYHVELHPTLRRPFKPRWEKIGDPSNREMGTMYAEADEVLTGLSDAYTGLRSAFSQGSRGN